MDCRVSFMKLAGWDEAHEVCLAPHFTLAELMLVDCREAKLLLSQFPHYVPCAILLLARFLEDFRCEIDAPVFISANGGYRSPAHQIGGARSIHAWGTAANIYRVGDTFLSDAKSIRKYRAIAASLSPAVFVRPFGGEKGQTSDHLHIDLGYASLAPRECSEAS
jgi:Peptidase M15